MLKKTVSLTLLLVLFVGCTPTHTVSYKSNPSGATIYCDGKRLGLAPLNVHYPISEELEDIGILSIKGCTARWISGANTPPRELILDLPLVHFSFSDYSFIRPNFPNPEADEIFALEREKVLLLKRQEKDSSDFDDNDDNDAREHRGGVARMHIP